MELGENPIKAALKAQRKLIGSWVMSGNPAIAEAMGCCGLDFLILDMEHSATDLPQMADLLRAVAATPAEAIVRLAGHDPVTLRRVLDAGARTVMVPFIDTPEQAAALVRNTRYPPEGDRGLAMMIRASRYGRATDYTRTANSEVCFIAQIETRAALQALPRIAAVDGVDALFFGPGDLSAAAGVPWQVRSDTVRELMADASAQCRAAGLAAGTVVPDAASMGWAHEAGFSLLSAGNDMAFVVSGASNVAATGADLGKGAAGQT